MILARDAVQLQVGLPSTVGLLPSMEGKRHLSGVEWPCPAILFSFASFLVIPHPSDRAMLYTLAAFTGLRESELASLTPESFDLASDSPSITVAAAYSKRRRTDTALLRPDLAELARDWLAQRPSGPLWPGVW
jgi:hypothetical protein